MLASFIAVLGLLAAWNSARQGSAARCRREGEHQSLLNAWQELSKEKNVATQLRIWSNHPDALVRKCQGSFSDLLCV